MGQLRVVVTLHPRAEGEARRLEALVDPGAGYTVVPRPVLEALGCAPSWGSASTRSTAGSCRWRFSSPPLANESRVREL